jgi:nicotinamidase-related amidase
MSSIVYLRALSDPSVAPCLVLVDLQREYIVNTRLMAVSHSETVLSRCRAALEHARAKGFPVAYMRQIIKSAFFNPATDFASWISGFEPTGADMVFERDKPSCYASKQFSAVMDSCGGHFVLAGFTGETACLSTAVDAYHRNHQFTLLTNATASRKLGTLSAARAHDAVVEIVGLYGNTLSTEEWIAATSNKAGAFESEARV